MRQRLDELFSGTTFEQIEGLLSQIGEKDKLIGQLTSTVHEMRNEVLKSSLPKNSSNAESEKQLAECERVYQAKIA
jgi:chromosome segregation ATPase